MRARPTPIAWILMLTLAAAACGTDEPQSSAPPAPPAAGPINLKGICPDPVIVQTNWFPQSEHGSLYHLVGRNPTIDAAHKRVTGPLIVNGKSTGVRIQIRAGGPAVGFQSSAALMYQDPRITLGMLQADEIIQLSKTQPVLGVVAPLDLDPQILLWDPEQHPTWRSIADIGQTDTKVFYFEGQTFMAYLIGSGILRASQVDGSYNGSPAAFVASGGKVAVQGYATNEPWTYQHEVKAWGKPVDFQLIGDSGYPNYGNVLTVRADHNQPLADCLRQLVPIIQQAQVQFMADPAAAIDLILKVNDAYKGGFIYSKANAEFAVRQLRELGIVADGTDHTLGNFDPERIQKLIAIVRPIFAAQRKPIRENLTPEQVFSSEFIAPAVSLR
jgi:hypothetical protein